MKATFKEASHNGISAIPKWEASKENAAPIKRGRRVEQLEQSIATQFNDDTQLNNELIIREYERLIQPTEAEGYDLSEYDSTEIMGDPLKNWVRYIQFYQDTFPADTYNQLNLVERCFRAMSRIRKYHNDERFIKICCVFADKSKRPHDIFKYCHESRIGSEVAIFWIAWAYVAEKEGNFPFAEKIFEKGIRRKAQPMKLLQQRLKHFQRRMSRHWLNSTMLNDDGEYHEEEAADRKSRGAFASLDQESFARNDRSTSTFQSNQRRERIISTGNRQAQPQFPIFNDENAENINEVLEMSSETSDKPFPRDIDLRKENTLVAARWTQYGALSSTSAYTQRSASSFSVYRPAPAAFNIFVDGECTEKSNRFEQERKSKENSQRLVRDERTFQERKEASVADRLSDDPLRYVKNPARLVLDFNAGEELKPTALRKHSSKTQLSSKALAWPSSFNPIHLGLDECLEEARARSNYFVLVPGCNNFNYFRTCNMKGRADDVCQQGISGSNMCIDDASIKCTDYTPRNSSTVSSTVLEAIAEGFPERKDEQTINTAWAHKEISMMFFGSPVVEPDQSLEDKTTHLEQLCVHNQSTLLEVEAELNNSFTPANVDHRITAQLDAMSLNQSRDHSSVVQHGCKHKHKKSKHVEINTDSKSLTGQIDSVFQIYCDEPATEPCSNSFAIYNDTIAPHKQPEFQIFQDVGNDSEQRDGVKRMVEPVFILPNDPSCSNGISKTRTGKCFTNEQHSHLDDSSDIFARQKVYIDMVNLNPTRRKDLEETDAQRRLNNTIDQESNDDCDTVTSSLISDVFKDLV